MAEGESGSPSLVVDWFHPSEPLQELSALTSERNFVDGEQVKQNANTLNGEPLNDLPAPTVGSNCTDGEQLRQNANTESGELLNESLSSSPDGKYDLISRLENEKALLSEPPNESPAVDKPAGELPETATPMMENALAASEPPCESPTVDKPAGELPETATSVMENALAASEPPYESPTVDKSAFESILTKPLMMESVPSAGELLSKSQTSTPDSVETPELPMVETGDAHVPKEKLSQIPKSLTGTALARRLGVSTGSISRNKTKENFGQWAFQHDPDGISWYFDGQTFRSVISNLSSG